MTRADAGFAWRPRPRRVRSGSGANGQAGPAIAVLIDATIIRSVLVPASMRLLGKWNWYLPNVLRWLPDLRVEAAEPAQVATPAD